MKAKTKAKVNFIIDAIMFLCMMVLAGSGFVRKYVLLSGRESHALYGKGVHLSLLGFDREAWSDIHLILGFILLGLLILHIVLHWKAIGVMYRQLIKNAQTRIIMVLIFVLVSILLISFPFIISPVIK